MKQLPTRFKTLLPTLLLLLTGAVIAMVLLRQCSDHRRNLMLGSAADIPSGGDTIDVAIDFSPVSYYAEGDSISGFNYEMLRMISSSTGLPVKFHPLTSLDEALAGLSSGIYDLVAADIPVILEYKDQFLFTEPVYLDRQVVVEHRDPQGNDNSSLISSQLDLGHKHVWVVSDSPSENRLRNLASEIGDTIFIHSNPDYSAELLFLMTSIGEIDYCVINERVANALAEKDGTAAIAANISFTQFQAWALRLDSEPLKTRIDSAIIAIKNSGTYRHLTEKYL